MSFVKGSKRKNNKEVIAKTHLNLKVSGKNNHQKQKQEDIKK